MVKIVVLILQVQGSDNFLFNKLRVFPSFFRQLSFALARVVDVLVVHGTHESPVYAAEVHDKTVFLIVTRV